MTRCRVPAGEGAGELTEKRSRFIGRIWRTDTEEEAQRRIRETRESLRDASHHVFAYVIREGGVLRCSDDGEPQGTAGVPVLNVLQGAGLVNVCCVVTRYFGGTLLGVGGLCRAYAAAARLALESAGAAVLGIWKRYRIVCPYGRYDRLRQELDSCGAAVERTDYGADVTVTVWLPEESAEAVCAAVADLTAGAVRPAYLDESFRALETGERI